VLTFVLIYSDTLFCLFEIAYKLVLAIIINVTTIVISCSGYNNNLFWL
jgi:hypothetical protein